MLISWSSRIREYVKYGTAGQFLISRRATGAAEVDSFARSGKFEALSTTRPALDI
jgi:hypothetical protein